MGKNVLYPLEKNEIYREIIELLIKIPNETATTYYKYIEKSRATLHKQLCLLEKEGWISSKTKGKKRIFNVTPKGFDIFKQIIILKHLEGWYNKCSANPYN